MATLEDPPSAKQLYLDNLGLIDEIISYVCRTSRFPPADAEDFRQEVHLKLIEDDYRILRDFRGSSLRSYLKVVILRAGQDYRNHLWGKFHASAEANRLGEAAVLLEQLMVRDGLSYSEAREHLRTNLKFQLTDQEFDRLLVRLPPRTRRQNVPIEAVENAPAAEPSPEESLLAREGEDRMGWILRVLRQVTTALPSQHELLLKLLYEDGLSIADIAKGWGVAQKPLYRERDRALESLRRELTQHGITQKDLEEILAFILDPKRPRGPEGG
jgi:RNA polymerase sigma factor (sigma-70 family)